MGFHDNWAEYYDYVCEKSYGYYFKDLTSLTIATITSILERGVIIDFGAGTGRLSIPLSQKGYDVVAVEKSSGMADVLDQKSLNENLKIPIYRTSISTYSGKSGDMALALFNVLNYCISLSELEDSLRSISNSVKPDSYFFMDIINRQAYTSEEIVRIETKKMRRIISLAPTGMNEIYKYSERCSGEFKGKKFEYSDETFIRMWDLEFIEKILDRYGLKNTGRDFKQFDSSGSHYRLYSKPN